MDKSIAERHLQSLSHEMTGNSGLREAYIYNLAEIEQSGKIPGKSRTAGPFIYLPQICERFINVSIRDIIFSLALKISVCHKVFNLINFNFFFNFLNDLQTYIVLLIIHKVILQTCNAFLYLLFLYPNQSLIYRNTWHSSNCIRSLLTAVYIYRSILIYREFVWI